MPDEAQLENVRVGLRKLGYQRIPSDTKCGCEAWRRPENPAATVILHICDFWNPRDGGRRQGCMEVIG